MGGVINGLAAPAATAAADTPALAPDGTPIIHKSSHKKKPKVADAAAASTHSSATNAASVIRPAVPTVAVGPAPGASADKKKPADSVVATKAPAPVSFSTPVPPSPSSKGTEISVPLHDSTTAITLPSPVSTSGSPTVETGLPVARHDGSTSTTASPTSENTSYRSSIFSTLSPLSPDPGQTRHTSSLSLSSPASKFPFTDFEKKTHTYPWKVDIITTIFWIGEGDTPISSTTNEKSAWDEEWQESNGGTDLPNDLKGYASGKHFSMVNPFYVALPFNDLAFPDKARRWMPSWWFQPPQKGRQVSGCQHRWVEIKNAQGDHCFAQWEDVGPLRYDHAEYVFGSDRPDTYSRAGLDVSPAVAKYLSIDGKNNITRWRFVDAEDVPPGTWLKLEEQALLGRAMKDPRNLLFPTPASLPIQSAAAPIDDATKESNKKKAGAAKG